MSINEMNSVFPMLFLGALCLFVFFATIYFNVTNQTIKRIKERKLYLLRRMKERKLYLLQRMKERGLIK